MNTKAAAISVVSLFLCFLAGAQQTEEYSAFRESAGYMSIIYRGPESHKYNFIFNGTPYWDTPAFLTGDLMYNGKLYTGVMMNVDAVRNELLLRPGDGLNPVVADKSMVEWFTMGEAGFVKVEDGAVKGLPGGYYQEICSLGQEKFYCRVEKVRSYDVSVTADMTGYKDPNFKGNVHDYFRINRICYFQRGSEAKVITGKSALLSEFKSRSRELRRYASENHLNAYGVSLSDYARGIFSYLERHED